MQGGIFLVERRDEWPGEKFREIGIFAPRQATLIRPCGAPSPRGEGMGVPRLRARGTDCHGQSADWSRNDRDARRQIFLVKPIDIVGFMCYHALTYKKDMLKE